MSFKDEVVKTVKTRFLSGILVIVPLFVAIAVLKFLIETVDNFIKPHLVRLFGQEFGFPFVGIAVTLILIILAGIFTTNVLGQRLLRLWELAVVRIPLFGTVYSASKQLVEGFAVPEKRTFEKVALVEYPRKGVYALGFVANRIRVHLPDGEKEFLSVFIPSTPTPFTGIAILYPRAEVIILDISIEEALKFVVSGSVTAPHQIRSLPRNESRSVAPEGKNNALLKEESGA